MNWKGKKKVARSGLWLFTSARATYTTEESRGQTNVPVHCHFNHCPCGILLKALTSLELVGI